MRRKDPEGFARRGEAIRQAEKDGLFDDELNRQIRQDLITG